MAVASQEEVLLGYLEFFRETLIGKLEGLPEGELRVSRLPSGWTPVELLKHLRYVELRWLVWGFDGQQVDDPWGDRQGDRWHVAGDESVHTLIADLRAQGSRTRSIVEAHELSAIGQPGPRWAGAEPATLERILLHLLQEYARHVGHIDIVAEMAGCPIGE